MIISIPSHILRWLSISGDDIVAEQEIPRKAIGKYTKDIANDTQLHINITNSNKHFNFSSPPSFPGAFGGKGWLCRINIWRGSVLHGCVHTVLTYSSLTTRIVIYLTNSLCQREYQFSSTNSSSLLHNSPPTQHPEPGASSSFQSNATLPSS